MKKLIFAAVLGWLCNVSDVSAVSGQVQAHVLWVGTYGNGDFFLNTDQQISEPGCNSTRIDLIASHSEISHWLAVAMAALASGKSIVFQTNGCFKSHPTLDNTTNSYFYLIN